MSTDGLWLAEFQTPLGHGSGVVVIDQGRVRGGDAGYYYVGSLSETAGRLSGTLHILHYAGPTSSVFGPIRSITLNLEGTEGQGYIIASGRDQRDPFGPRISIKLRRADIQVPLP